jgi:hypothetical protein
MHVSKEMFNKIVKEYRLPTELAMFSQVPQMATYHMQIPIDDDHVGTKAASEPAITSLRSLVVHARSAISISNASHLSYCYQKSSKSIYGVLLDRRERSEGFIKKLESLQASIGNRYLPMVALTHHALEISNQDAERTEELYYIAKMIWSIVSRHHGLDDEDHSFPTVIKDLHGIVTTRKLQVSAINNLLKFLRKNVSEDFSLFHPLLDAIESVNDGNRLVVDRHQERHDSLVASSQYRIQVELDRKTYRSTKSNEASLKRTEELLEAIRITNERTQRIMDDQRAVAESQRAIQHEASVNGRLTAILAVIAALALPASTVAVRVFVKTQSFPRAYFN